MTKQMALVKRLREWLEDDECGDGFHLWSGTHDHECVDFDHMRDVKEIIDEFIILMVKVADLTKKKSIAEEEILSLTRYVLRLKRERDDAFTAVGRLRR